MPIRSLQNPGAGIPMALSLAGSSKGAGHALLFGVTRAADEGTPAHVFPLLMALPLPLLAWRFVRFLPTDRRRAMGVLGIQACLALLAISTVRILT